jgi:hypothetical protein
MKVDAKLAELVHLTHKFAKQSRVWIFHNERTRSNPLDQKLIFWDISDLFVNAPNDDAKLAKLAPLTHKFAKGSCIEIFRNERTWPSPLHAKLMFWVFQIVSLLHQIQCKNWLNWRY